jgi:hypothetical protein
VQAASVEEYKSTTIEKVKNFMKIMEDNGIQEFLIIYFPSVNKVDE